MLNHSLLDPFDSVEGSTYLKVCSITTLNLSVIAAEIRPSSSSTGWDLSYRVREAAKKSSSFNGRAIKALTPPPPPSGLMAIELLFVFNIK